MRFNLNLKKKFQRFCLLLIFLLVLIFQSDIPNLKALTMDNYQGEMVIEELRLKVPAVKTLLYQWILEEFLGPSGPLCLLFVGHCNSLKILVKN